MEVKLLATIQMTKSKNNFALIDLFSDIEIKNFFAKYSNGFSGLKIENLQDVQVQPAYDKKSMHDDKKPLSRWANFGCYRGGGLGQSFNPFTTGNIEKLDFWDSNK